MGVFGPGLFDCDGSEETYYGILDMYDWGEDLATIQEEYPLQEWEGNDDFSNELYITVCALAYHQIVCVCFAIDIFAGEVSYFLIPTYYKNSNPITWDEAKNVMLPIVPCDENYHWRKSAGSDSTIGPIKSRYIGTDHEAFSVLAVGCTYEHIEKAALSWKITGKYLCEAGCSNPFSPYSLEMRMNPF